MEKLKKICNRIFIEGLSGMAQGLFATLLVGTILEQIGTFIGGSICLLYTSSYFAISTFDALCHGVESYLSPAATPFTELYSKKTIDMVLKGYMEIAARGPDSRFDSLDNYLLALSLIHI